MKNFSIDEIKDFLEDKRLLSVAARAGLSAKTLDNIVNERVKPNQKTIERMSAYMHAAREKLKQPK